MTRKYFVVFEKICIFAERFMRIVRVYCVDNNNDRLKNYFYL